uniref:Cadherin-related tumor suppressor n=1 Tax=Angiostrongylus cantonensis TaxID=6313 RepID=A0A158P8G1_ANGCA
MPYEPSTTKEPGPKRLAPVFNPPQITVTVDENEAEVEIAKVHATYPDGRPGSISYVLHKGDPTMFEVSSTSGKVKLLRPLDAEKDTSYMLQISTAEVSALTSDPLLDHHVSITVNVGDANDWIPTFENSNYSFTIQEGTTPGTIIGQVSAFDQDKEAPNNRIRYRLVSAGGLENYFSVNSETGLITLALQIDAFAGEKITLQIEASDSGSPPQSAMASVLFEIVRNSSKVNQTVRSFSNRPSEGALQFSHRNYTVTAGNDGNCELRTQMELDRESVERYLLNVTVTSGNEDDFTLVSVTVIDVNDNVPRFIYDNDLGISIYFAGISFAAEAFTKVVTVKNPKEKQRVQVSACDSPTTGQQLCAKADVVINIITESHRFRLTAVGQNPQQLKVHEKNILKTLRQFTGSCTLLSVESMVKQLPSDNQVSHHLIRTDMYWYAVNPTTKNICKKNDFRKLFESSSVAIIAGKLQPWFQLEKIEEDVDAGVDIAGGMLSNNWKTASIMLIGLATLIAIGATIGICVICVFWSRFKGSQRSVHSFNPNGCSKKFNTVFLPNPPNDARFDKIYETQMLEMPISDEDLTLKNGTVGGRSRREIGCSNYGRQGSVAYEGDFSIEENMYALNIPGRIDPVTKYVQPMSPSLYEYRLATSALVT